MLPPIPAPILPAGPNDPLNDLLSTLTEDISRVEARVAALEGGAKYDGPSISADLAQLHDRVSAVEKAVSGFVDKTAIPDAVAAYDDLKAKIAAIAGHLGLIV